MNKSTLTNEELQEGLFSTLERLRVAIRQASYGKEHLERALALRDKVEADTDKLLEMVKEATDLLNSGGGGQHDSK